MKIIKILSFLLIAFVLSFLGFSKIYGQQELPVITTACESRNGLLRAFDDGFSIFKNCPNGSRRVVLIGEQGPKGEKGDKGDQGETGPQGPKGDTGDSGFIPDKIIDVCFHVDTAALTVMKGGTCFPHVHWRIPVQCVSGRPCQPDNPEDSFFDPLQ